MTLLELILKAREAWARKESQNTDPEWASEAEIRARRDRESLLATWLSPEAENLLSFDPWSRKV